MKNKRKEIKKIELLQKIGQLELKHLKILLKQSSHPIKKRKFEQNIMTKKDELKKLVQKKANLKRPPRTKAWSRRADNKTVKRYCSTDKIIMNFISANQNSKKYICPRCKVIHILKALKSRKTKRLYLSRGIKNRLSNSQKISMQNLFENHPALNPRE